METITLTEFINSFIKGKEYPKGTNIIINKTELSYNKELSVYNYAFFNHYPTGGHLYIQYSDDENFVEIYFILPNENPMDSYWKHHLADDYADDFLWNKLDDDYEKDELNLEYGTMFTL